MVLVELHAVRSFEPCPSFRIRNGRPANNFIADPGQLGSFLWGWSGNVDVNGIYRGRILGAGKCRCGRCR